MITYTLSGLIGRPCRIRTYDVGVKVPCVTYYNKGLSGVDERLRSVVSRATTLRSAIELHPTGEEDFLFFLYYYYNRKSTKCQAFCARSYAVFTENGETLFTLLLYYIVLMVYQEGLEPSLG